MSSAQERVLLALGRQSMTLVGVASAVDGRVPETQKVLDALYRRSWVTITPMGRYCATDRGRRKVAS